MAASSLTEDDFFKYIPVTAETLEGALKVLRGSFFIHEKLCIGVELHQHPQAAIELEELGERAARDGVSIIAVEKKTGEVVGVAFNKLQVKPFADEPSYFAQYAANCKYPSSKDFVQLMNDVDADAKLFESTKANCLLEIMYLAVLPESRNRGVGNSLIEKSISLGRALKGGVNVKTPFEGKPLSLEPIPTAVCAIFTSKITQHLGKKIGFVTAAERSYETFTFQGKTFASRIGPETPFTTVEYKVL